MLGLIPPLVMAAVDPRWRPVGATIAYGISLFVLAGWQLASSPAFRPLVPGAVETAAALGLVVAAAILGGRAARRLSDTLAAAADWAQGTRTDSRRSRLPHRPARRAGGRAAGRANPAGYSIRSGCR